MDAKRLIEEIYSQSLYKQGEFILSSGVKSTYYLDMRPLILDTRYVHLITTGLIQLLTDYSDGKAMLNRGTLLCGVITSGLHLAGTMLQRLSTCAIDTSSIYCRTEHRNHGQKKHIEGTYKEGQPVIIIDDVCTSGSSIIKVRNILVSHGLVVHDALVIAERTESDGREALKSLGVELHSLISADRGGIWGTKRA